MDNDSLQISLITCSPGHDTYAMFGHTAIRVTDYRQQPTTQLRFRDVVYNYGMFNYNSENFIYRFVKGETDYILGIEPADFFFERYNERGVTVTEQILNLTLSEKETLSQKLIVNSMPENRTYRYNWLYDNCTTRARDAIESSIDGEVTYKTTASSALRHRTTSAATPYAKADDTASSVTNDCTTTRDILHEYTAVSDWTRFGIDMVLGEEIDRPLTARQQMFIPANYMDAADGAVITDASGSQRPLVSATITPIRSAETRPADNTHSSLMCTTGLLFVAVGLAFIELQRRKTFKWFDASLAFVLGLAGCLIAFLFFFSEHAGVDTNYLVLLFNPLHFIAIPFILRRQTKVLSYVTLAVVLLFLLTILLTGQNINIAILPVAFTLLVRIAVNLGNFSYLCKLNNKK